MTFDGSGFRGQAASPAQCQQHNHKHILQPFLRLNNTLAIKGPKQQRQRDHAGRQVRAV
jgi:hypothetical protein